MQSPSTIARQLRENLYRHSHPTRVNDRSITIAAFLIHQWIVRETYRSGVLGQEIRVYMNALS